MASVKVSGGLSRRPKVCNQCLFPVHLWLVVQITSDNQSINNNES